MKPEEIFHIVRSVCSEIIGVDEAEVTMDAELQEDLGASPFDIAEIFAVLEDRFQVEVPREGAHGIKTMKTVNEIVEFIEEEIS